MPKYFDIHSHLNATQYKDDLEGVIARMQESETHTIVVGTELESSKRAVELADRYEEIYATVGIHPTDKLESFEVLKFESLVNHPKVVAVGECGLDFFHKDKEEDFERQKKLFEDQINFAVKHDKPLMLHIRDAYEEALNILTYYSKLHTPILRGNVHFFAGSLDIAKRFIALGFTLSFTGVITFTKDYDEVIREVPLESIMSETDAPYVAPVPHRGKRNEPSNVCEVVKRIAKIKDLEEEMVRERLVQNAISMIR